jgi:hypothetical protein
MCVASFYIFQIPSNPFTTHTHSRRYCLHTLRPTVPSRAHSHRYNDVSVLENYHASVCFALLQDPDCNILSALPKAQFRECRAAIVSCILHTDMSKHNDIVKSLKVCLARAQNAYN